jgi:hypothetical protein
MIEMRPPPSRFFIKNNTEGWVVEFLKSQGVTKKWVSIKELRAHHGLPVGYTASIRCELMNPIRPEFYRVRERRKSTITGTIEFLVELV